MTQEERRELYKKFMDAYGEQNEITVAIEEMSELTKEFCKYLRYLNSDNTIQKIEETRANIKEELADVLNTTEALVGYFGEDDIRRIQDEKLRRGIKRMVKKQKPL